MGNEAFKRVLADRCDGDDSGIMERSSKLGCATGIEIAGGARKIVFSTFARALENNKLRTRYRSCCIVFRMTR